jgi:hypothetical protein
MATIQQIEDTRQRDRESQLKYDQMKAMKKEELASSIIKAKFKVCNDDDFITSKQVKEACGKGNGVTLRKIGDLYDKLVVHTRAGDIIYGLKIK